MRRREFIAGLCGAAALRLVARNQQSDHMWRVTSPRHSIAVVAMLLAPLLNPKAYAAEKMPADLVLVQQGTLPIILTAPHGGREAIPGVAPRDLEGKSKGGRWNGYVAGSDTNTDILAERIAAEIKVLTGKEAYLVMAGDGVGQRRRATLLRPLPRLDPPFRRRGPQKISGGLADRCPRPKRRPGGAHARHAKRPHDHALLQRAGGSAVTGPKGIFGQLEANGFKVFPANDLPTGGTSENGGKNGGYTVAIYGSNTPNGIDAIQFEFGGKYRQIAVLDKFAKDAASAIVVFYEAYLKNPGK
jgi:hypothetical protein